MHFLFDFKYDILILVIFMTNKNNDDKININLSGIEFFLIVIIGIIIGGGITLFFLKPTNNTKYVDENIKNIVDTYNIILDSYYEDLDKVDIVNGAIKGMLEATGDPYTTYMGDDYNVFDITMNGEYEGLGIEVGSLNDEIIIIGVLSDSPASEVGLQVGDIILAVDNEKMSISDFTNYIENSEKNIYHITVKRESNEKEFDITKRKITLKSVLSKIYNKNDKKIGYIYGSVFARNTYTQFKNELNKLKDENIDSLILDLRDNSGGELDAVTNMISLFLNNDKIIYQIEDRDGKKEITYSKGNEDFENPILILTNGNTASASEVMSAALKENLNAILIGTQTYGKGTVQYVHTAENGSKYKITTRKWLTTNGICINKVGLEPDIKVALVKGNDNQLESAIKYIIKK